MAIVLLPTVPLAIVAVWAAGSDDRPEPTANVEPAADRTVLRTPLMSVRRAPQVMADDLNGDDLRAELVPFQDQLNDTSCLQVDIGDTVVTATRPDLAVIPASNEKLLVAAVALELLGPDHRFATTVVGDLDPATGTVSGDLVLIGGGDPLLATDWYPDSNLGPDYPQRPATRLEDLADAVAAAGVRSVVGSVVGDESRYDSERFRDDLPDELYGEIVGPYGALLVNDARMDEGGALTDDPALGAAQLFADLLAERGVTVQGGVTTGVAAAGATEIARVESAPFSEVLAHTMQTSDNNSAEMLLKEIAVAAGRPGTTLDGTSVLVETLFGLGLPTQGTAPVDGSGLDITNQTTCALLAGILSRTGTDSVLADSLPLLGVEGTLDDELVDHPMAGKVGAKTGSLGQDDDVTDVKALSGVVPVAGAPGIVFSLVMNGGTVRDEATYQPLWSDLLDALATYPSAPPAADLDPLGPRKAS